MSLYTCPSAKVSVGRSSFTFVIRTEGGPVVAAVVVVVWEMVVVMRRAT